NRIPTTSSTATRVVPSQVRAGISTITESEALEAFACYTYCDADAAPTRALAKWTYAHSWLVTHRCTADRCHRYFFRKRLRLRFLPGPVATCPGACQSEHLSDHAHL